jgi:hypothetical protein
MHQLARRFGVLANRKENTIVCIARKSLLRLRLGTRARSEFRKNVRQFISRMIQKRRINENKPRPAEAI